MVIILAIIGDFARSSAYPHFTEARLGGSAAPHHNNAHRSDSSSPDGGCELLCANLLRRVKRTCVDVPPGLDKCNAVSCQCVIAFAEFELRTDRHCHKIEIPLDILFIKVLIFYQQGQSKLISARCMQQLHTTQLSTSSSLYY